MMGQLKYACNIKTKLYRKLKLESLCDTLSEILNSFIKCRFSPSMLTEEYANKSSIYAQTNFKFWNFS